MSNYDAFRQARQHLSRCLLEGVPVQVVRVEIPVPATPDLKAGATAMANLQADLETAIRRDAARRQRQGFASAYWAALPAAVQTAVRWVVASVMWGGAVYLVADLIWQIALRNAGL